MVDRPQVFWNDRVIPQAEAGLPLHDVGLVQGVTITDLVRTFRHELFHFSDHLERFRQSATLAEVPLRLTDAEITRQAQELVNHNAKLLPPHQDLVLVLLATPGPVAHYLVDNLRNEPTLIMHTFPLPFARYAPLFQEGARLVIPSVIQVSSQSVDPRIKQRSRIHWWLADREAQRLLPGASALLQDQEGHLTETAAANFLLVRDGTILCPPKGTILPGVSLHVTKHLCQKLRIPVAERLLKWENCLEADEALLTSTPYGVAGVSRINTLQLTWPGAITSRLQQAWNDKVGLDIKKQILSFR